MKRNIDLLFVFYCLSMQAFAANATQSDNYVFDETLMKGSGFPVDDVMQYLSRDSIKPGVYQVDVKLNGVFLFHGDVTYKDNEGKTTPCFTQEQLKKIPFKRKNILQESDFCVFLKKVSPGVAIENNFSNMSLDLIIPDVDLVKEPRGYVPPDNLSDGESMLLTNYNINQYYSHFSGLRNSNYKSTWIGLNNGLNIGMWQLRYQGSWSRSDPGSSMWSTNRAYIQRPILPLRSELIIGDNYSSGNIFSGLAFRGVLLKSDDRMLPQSQRGYAPVIRGVADSNAKVTVRQGNALIYEKTVPPGNFEINDLNPMSYSGDLTVSVTEANGSVNTFTVPYAALPESVRQGMYKYSAILGRSRYIGDNDLFGEVTTQYGLSNNITANIGMRAAQGYTAVVLGAVYANSLGAFGLDSTYSRANLPDSGKNGWMFHANYTKRIDASSTTLAIGGYHYSTSGYRDLSDYFGVKQALREHNNSWSSSTLNQSSRLEASITQDFGELGSIWLSGSTQQYRDGRSDDKQYQIGYSHQFNNGISFNISVARTRYSTVSWAGNNSGTYQDNTDYGNSHYTPEQQTLSSITLSIPFGSKRQNILSTSMTQQQGIGTSMQTTLSGSLDTVQPVSYGLSYSRDSSHTGSIGLTGQTTTSVGSIQGSVSHSKSYNQGSASMQGSVVIHKDGITAGPYLGETFALIEAKGASGAKIQGVPNASINRFGFALTPAIVPYQYNNIALDSVGINNDAEISSGSQRIAPYYGSMVRVTFSVLRGYPLLMHIRSAKNIPLGAEVYNHDNISVGMVGQGNLAWIRNDKLEDTLAVKWGNGGSCALHYKIIDAPKDAELIKADGDCN